MDYLKLKSGTDIRGVAVETETEKITLTDGAVKDIAASLLCWCERRLGKKPEDLRVAVGRDSRISGPAIADVITSVLTGYGATVLDCGLSSTPSMFFAIRSLPCDISVQITASHHPYYRNGLKFFTASGGLEADDISEILEGANSGLKPEKALPGRLEKADNMARYSASLRDAVIDGVGAGERPLEGFHIVVDAGNGAGGFYATQVLEPLGADISGSQFLEPDGMFPNHIPNPENAAAMEAVSRAVVDNRADLGVIFDADVDRGAVADRNGREINRNRLVALASAITIKEHPGTTVVTDSITSDGLKEYIENHLGGRHHRFKRGYKNVINEALRLNAEGTPCFLAIETSGHAAMKENHFLDDGAYLVTKIIIEMAALRKAGRDLEDLLAPLKEPAEAKEVRIPITESDFKTRGSAVIEALEAHARASGWAIAPDNREGIRVSFPQGGGDGWFLLRLSVHDPILPLNLESNTPGGTDVIAEKLREFFRAHSEGLDISPLM